VLGFLEKEFQLQGEETWRHVALSWDETTNLFNFYVDGQPKTQTLKPKTRNPKPETRNPKSEIRNTKYSRHETRKSRSET
jgi:hypothetical protein